MALITEVVVVLAANQGLYNGFIAAGLLWGVVQGAARVDRLDPGFGFQLDAMSPYG